MLQLFPNGGATDIVFVTVLHSSLDSNCVVRWLLRNAGRTLPYILMFWRRSTAALVFRVGACFEVSLTLMFPFSHSSPSLIGLLASVDVKQQSLSQSCRVPAQLHYGMFCGAKYTHHTFMPIIGPASCHLEYYTETYNLSNVTMHNADHEIQTHEKVQQNAIY